MSFCFLSPHCMSLWLLSFVAGMLTVLAPCTLPLLPVLFWALIGGASKVRMRRVLAAFWCAVLVLTIWLKVVFAGLPLDVQNLRYVSASIFIIFGAFLLFPHIRDRLMASLWTQQRVDAFLQHPNSSLWYDISLWVALWPLFNSCSPTYLLLVATILPAHLWQGIILTFFYIAWVTIMLAFLLYGGRAILRKLPWIMQVVSSTKYLLGIFMILLGLAIIRWLDKWLAEQIISLGWQIDTTMWEVQQLR